MDTALDNGVFAKDNTIAPKAIRVLPLFSLKGKTAVVTGAGAGIGRAVAQAYAEAGANVAMWYNSNQEAVGRAAEIESEYGVKCQAYQADVTDEEAVVSALDSVLRDFDGRLDIFVANAGIPWTQGAMTSGSVSHYRKVITTDLDSVFFCARAAAKVWRRQAKEGTDTLGRKLENYSSGSFVATASMSGHIVNFPQLQSAYNCAKAGVIHLCKSRTRLEGFLFSAQNLLPSLPITNADPNCNEKGRSLAIEWIQFARCNTVSPGYMATELTDFVPAETKDIWRSKIPMGREGEAHELKGAYLYFASDAASYTTGADLIVDGGYCVP